MFLFIGPIEEAEMLWETTLGILEKKDTDVTFVNMVFLLDPAIVDELLETYKEGAELFLPLIESVEIADMLSIVSIEVLDKEIELVLLRKVLTEELTLSDNSVFGLPDCRLDMWLVLIASIKELEELKKLEIGIADKESLITVELGEFPKDFDMLLEWLMDILGNGLVLVFELIVSMEERDVLKELKISLLDKEASESRWVVSVFEEVDML